MNQTILPNEIVLVKDGPLTDDLEDVIDWVTGNPDFKNEIDNFKNKAVTDADLIVDIEAPSPEAPSMIMAIENYIKLFFTLS